jgi:7-keto-8-aminopelargonate synthetase-like enzyme
LQQNIALLTNQKTPIIPHILGSNEKALAASEKLSQLGFLVPAIRYPTVPRNSARLRISLSAVHSESAILDLKKHLAAL